MRLAERVARSLAETPKLPPLAGDLPEERALATTRAAVLIALTERDHPGLILTVRREHLRTHAGQIAFPGGRIDDGEEAVEAALREAREELGVPPSAVEVIAAIDEYRTVTGYRVTPVVGIISPGLDLQPHEHEVADWFEAPLYFLIDPANQRLQTAVFGGRERRYWQIEWNGRRIWGATAAMLVNLSRRLQWT
jgi:8-oxo-dGTP pyrophosphatase MutT (NUDIX family)